MITVKVNHFNLLLREIMKLCVYFYEEETRFDFPFTRFASALHRHQDQFGM